MAESDTTESSGSTVEVDGDSAPWCIILSHGAVAEMGELDWNWGGESDGTVFGPRNATPLCEEFLSWLARSEERDWLTLTDIRDSNALVCAFRCASTTARMIFDVFLVSFIEHDFELYRARA